MILSFSDLLHQNTASNRLADPSPIDVGLQALRLCLKAKNTMQHRQAVWHRAVLLLHSRQRPREYCLWPYHDCKVEYPGSWISRSTIEYLLNLQHIAPAPTRYPAVYLSMVLVNLQPHYDISAEIYVASSCKNSPSAMTGSQCLAPERSGCQKLRVLDRGRLHRNRKRAELEHTGIVDLSGCIIDLPGERSDLSMHYKGTNARSIYLLVVTLIALLSDSYSWFSYRLLGIRENWQAGHHLLQYCTYQM